MECIDSLESLFGSLLSMKTGVGHLPGLPAQNVSRFKIPLS